MERPVILYDDDCGFCRWSVAKILAWDRHERLRPMTLQSGEAGRLLGRMDPATRMASWHLVAANGTVYSADSAVAPLLRLLPAGTPIAALADAFPKPTAASYRWLTRHRGRLGRIVGEKACSVRPAGPSAL